MQFAAPRLAGRKARAGTQSSLCPFLAGIWPTLPRLAAPASHTLLNSAFVEVSFSFGTMLMVLPAF